MINRKGDYLFWRSFFRMGCIFFIVSMIMVKSVISINNYSSVLNPILLLGISIVIGSILTITGFLHLRRIKFEILNDKRVLRMGNYFSGIITDIYSNRSISSNRRSPLIIEGIFKDQFGKEYLVKSHNIWNEIPGTKMWNEYGELHINPNSIDLKIYVNPNNYEEYVMVIEPKNNNDKVVDLR